MWVGAPGKTSVSDIHHQRMGNGAHCGYPATQTPSSLLFSQPQSQTSGSSQKFSGTGFLPLPPPWSERPCSASAAARGGGLGGPAAGCLGLPQWLRLWLALLGLQASSTPQASGRLRSSRRRPSQGLSQAACFQAAATKPRSVLWDGGATGGKLAPGWPAPRGCGGGETRARPLTCIAVAWPN